MQDFFCIPFFLVFFCFRCQYFRTTVDQYRQICCLQLANSLWIRRSSVLLKPPRNDSNRTPTTVYQIAIGISFGEDLNMCFILISALDLDLLFDTYDALCNFDCELVLASREARTETQT